MKKLVILFFFFPCCMFSQQWHPVTTQDCSSQGSAIWRLFDIGKDSCISVGKTFLLPAPGPPALFNVCGTNNEFDSINFVTYSNYESSAIYDLNYITDTSANIIYYYNQYYIGYASPTSSLFNYPIPIWKNLGDWNNASWQNDFAYILFKEVDSASVFSYNKSTRAILQKKVFHNIDSERLLTMSFTNDSTGYVSLWDSSLNNNIVYKTSNYGSTWNNILTYTHSLNSIFFPSQSIGYAIANNGIILKTTNAGLIWSTLNFPDQDSLQCLFFLNNDTGYVAATNGHIHKTFNGGINWLSENSDVSTAISKIKMVNNNSAYFVCGNELYKNTSAYTTSIADNKQNVSIEIYPNPSEGNFVIEPNTTAKQTVQIYDITGKVVLSQIINGKTDINTEGLPAGIYNISFITSELIINKRIVIAR